VRLPPFLKMLLFFLTCSLDLFMGQRVLSTPPPGSKTMLQACPAPPLSPLAPQTTWGAALLVLYGSVLTKWHTTIGDTVDAVLASAPTTFTLLCFRGSILINGIPSACPYPVMG
jgi:hypothetical protein